MDIFYGFPLKNLTISDQYFQRFHCQKKDIRKCAVFSPTAKLQIFFINLCETPSRNIMDRKKNWHKHVAFQCLSFRR